MKDLRSVLRSYRLPNGDDPFYLYQEGRMSKGALLTIIEGIVDEILEPTEEANDD